MSSNKTLRKRKIPLLISPSITFKDIFYNINNKKRKNSKIISIVNKSNFNIEEIKKKNFEKLLPLMSKMILLNEINKIQRNYDYYMITFLIENQKSKINLYYKESKLFYDQKDYIDKFYKLKESLSIVPKFFNYYKNYLKYFCRPFICDKSNHKIILRHIEKAAEYYYNKNYDKKNKESNKKINFHIEKIFNNKIIKEIEKEKTNKSNEEKISKLKEDEDISSFIGISKINNNLNYDDSQLIKKKSFSDLFEIKKEEDDNKKVKVKKIIKKGSLQELKNNLSNLNLKYFSNISSPKKKSKDNKNIISKLKESFQMKTNISPNKLIIKSYNDFSTRKPLNIYKFKENKKLKNNNLSRSMKNIDKGISISTISTNLFQNFMKKPKRGVLFKNNNNQTSLSSLLIKSPSTQSKLRLNSSNKKNNSLGNIKNGSYILSPMKKLKKNNFDDEIVCKKFITNNKKKISEDSTRTGNSRNSNHSHQKIPMINLSKNQISNDFIKAYRIKYKSKKKKKKKKKIIPHKKKK